MSRYDRIPRAGADRTNLYDEITGKIIAQLEAGRLPWVQPVNRRRLDADHPICGVLIPNHSLMGGGTRQEPQISFTGFWSQGDGASYQAFYAYRKNATREIRSYAPKDTRLHAIVDDLLAIQRRNFYQLRAEVSHRGNYYHEYCMAISVERDSPTWQDMTTDAEDAVIEALRDLARWLYRQLEREYEYLSSDEAVDETIVVNQYTFTETGRRFG